MRGEPTFEAALHRLSLLAWAAAGFLVLSAIGIAARGKK